MDAAEVRAVLEHYLNSKDRVDAHKYYAEDAVLEFPQSGERFEGVENFMTWRAEYPAEVSFELDRLQGRDDFWVAEARVRYDDGPWNYGVSLMEFRDGMIAREIIYGGEAWEAPDWRAEWRAAPAV